MNIENEEGAVSGETISRGAEEGNRFLYGESTEQYLTQDALKQSRIGQEWLELAKRATHEEEKMMRNDNADTEYDMGLCESVREKTNKCNRCDDQLLNRLTILGPENSKEKK